MAPWGLTKLNKGKKMEYDFLVETYDTERADL